MCVFHTGQVDSSGSSDDSGSGQGMTCRTGEVMLVDGLNDKEGTSGGVHQWSLWHCL